MESEVRYLLDLGEELRRILCAGRMDLYSIMPARHVPHYAGANLFEGHRALDTEPEQIFTSRRSLLVGIEW